MGDLVPWGEWKPDVSAYKGGHAPVISNVFPQGDGYGPAPSFSELTDALPATCRGFFTAFDDDGTVSIFAGTSTRLYKLNNSTFAWMDVSKADTSELDYTGSSNIGDLTAGGGLAAGFDGTTAQAAAACASKAAATTAYIGKTLAAAEPIHSVKIYGSNDAGYVSAINPNVTVKLYGKTGTAPANGTDGTLLATLTPFADTADESVARTITSTDTTTPYLHVWLYFTHDGAANAINVAEIEFFGAVNYSVPSNDQWQWTQFGTRVIAVNANTTPQSYVMGSSSNYADLGGSPPQAQYVTTINEFVVLSGLTSDPFTIQWSSRSNPAEWTAGTNEGDNQTFQDGGLVRGVAGGEFGLVFQDRCIRRMTYAPGSAVVFEFDIVSEDIGLSVPYSIVQVQGLVFFLSTVGFFMFSSAGFKPIGKEKVDRTFLEDCDLSDARVIIGASDPSSSRVAWSYKSTSLGTDNQIDRIMIYDWVLDKWSRIIDQSGEYLAIGAIPSVTLENLDAISASIDGLGSSLDSYSTRFTPTLALANSSHIIGLFGGENLEAIMETPDIETGTRVVVRGARPITDAPTVYGSVSTRQRVTDSVSFGTETAMNSVGFTPHRTDTRIARLRNRIPASTVWNFSMGVEPDLVSSGKR
jgi:hypothetical protein